MRLHRFFVTERLSGRKRIALSDADLIHQLKRVFRLSAGDQIVLCDGHGEEYVCTIELLSAQEIHVRVEESRLVVSPSREVWLCVAIIKKDNFEWVVQKATELGVTHIVPIIALRSEKKSLHMERLLKIAREASEQSGRGMLPQVHEPMSLTEALEHPQMPEDKILFHTTGTPLLSAERSEPQPVALFIGPEGGWDEREIEVCTAHGVRVRTMGEYVLRAETAATVAPALFLIL